MSNIYNELLDFANVIYLSTHDEPMKIDKFIISTSNCGRPIFNSFSKIYGYTKNDYITIFHNYQNLIKPGAYQITDEDYLKCVNNGIIPNGKEELKQTISIEE